MIWPFKSKEEKQASLENDMKKYGEEWRKIRNDLVTYTKMFETSQKDVESFKNGTDKERYAQEEINRRGLLKKIEQLKKDEEKISEKVAKINSQLDHKHEFSFE